MSRAAESTLTPAWGRVGLRRFSLAREPGGRRQMQVRDGMSEVVLTVGPAHTLREAAAMMAEKRIGAALVSDDETPVPRILTERDILLSLGAGEDPDAERVGDHRSDSVTAASRDWSLERAAAEMSRR